MGINREIISSSVERFFVGDDDEVLEMRLVSWNLPTSSPNSICCPIRTWSIFYSSNLMKTKTATSHLRSIDRSCCSSRVCWSFWVPSFPRTRRVWWWRTALPYTLTYPKWVRCRYGCSRVCGSLPELRQSHKSFRHK